MAIKMECPHCNATFTVQEKHAGKKAKCTCGAKIIVPHGSDPSTSCAQSHTNQGTSNDGIGNSETQSESNSDTTNSGHSQQDPGQAASTSPPPLPSTRAFLNKHQVTALVVGAALTIILLIFPPWEGCVYTVNKHWSPGAQLWRGSHKKFAGFFFMFSKPEIESANVAILRINATYEEFAAKKNGLLGKPVSDLPDRSDDIEKIRKSRCKKYELANINGYFLFVLLAIIFSTDIATIVLLRTKD